MIIIVPDGMGDRWRGPGGLPQALSRPTIGSGGENTLNKPPGGRRICSIPLPRLPPTPVGVPVPGRGVDNYR